jgi:hypothetical protein
MEFMKVEVNKILNVNQVNKGNGQGLFQDNT